MITEKRLTQRLTRYWKLIGDGKTLPKIQKFNSAAVEDVWPQCFMVSVHTKGGITYRYEYMGEPVIAAYGSDLTGLTVDHKMKQFPGSVIIRQINQVVLQHKPCTSTGHLLNQRGQMVKYRACFLPFGTEKKGITHIVIGLSFRVF